jgi:mannose-6-phosphate isomerase-like protein (cupin superfamily)
MLEPRMQAIRTSRLRDGPGRCSILADRRRLAMSEYQIVKLEEVPDWLGDYPGEMRGITYAIGAEQVALTHRRMPQHTGSKGSYGHRHKELEELYFVLSGKLQFKFGDEVVEIGPREAVRVPPGTWRGVWNDEPEDAELIIVSRRIDDPQGDAERSAEDFWPR